MVFTNCPWFKMNIVLSWTQAKHCKHHWVQGRAHREEVRVLINSLGTWGREGRLYAFPGHCCTAPGAVPQQQSSMPCSSLLILGWCLSREWRWALGKNILSSGAKQVWFVPAFQECSQAPEWERMQLIQTPPFHASPNSFWFIPETLLLIFTDVMSSVKLLLLSIPVLD